MALLADRKRKFFPIKNSINKRDEYNITNVPKSGCDKSNLDTIRIIEIN